MSTRLLCILTGSQPGKVKHFAGFPPELTHREDLRKEMPTPAFLVIEENREGVFLYRYDAKGQCVGDTWHMNVDDAVEQADYEYEGNLGCWRNVPSDLDDVIAFGISSLERGSL